MASERRKNLYRSAGGFTLIELLVAIAVTAILLTLLFGPLVASFFFTGDAQTEAAAQATARTTMEQISRELNSAAGIRDTSSKYENVVVMAQDGTQALARSYGAYLDIVPPRPQLPSQNAEYDPTVESNPNNKTVSLNANGTEVTPPIILSLAPGTGIVRYFVGLRYPINLQYDIKNPPASTDPQPYYNPYEATSTQVRGLRQQANYGTSYVVKNNLTNTYILYRAEVQPTIPELDANGNIVKDASGNTIYVPNTQLFPCVYGQNDPNGTAGQPEPAGTAAKDSDAQPVLDDPDFFRIVSTGDVNPITINASTGVGTNYTATQAQEHNERVYYWSQIAKPVIGASVADLIAAPRDARGQIQYYYVDGTGKPTLSPEPQSNPGGTEVWPPLPTNTFVDDPTNNNTPDIPVERMSVSFGPALVSNDTLAAANNQYASQGAGANQLDLAGTPPYIPTVFQAAYGQWQGTPVFTIYQNDQNGNPIVQTGASATSGVPYYMTGQATATDLTLTLSNNANLNRSGTPPDTNPQPGDLMEYDSEAITNGVPSNPVYDVTLSTPIQGAKHYVALTFNPASGTVSFAINAQPTNGSSPFNYDYRDQSNLTGNPFWNIPAVGTGSQNDNAQGGLYFNGADNVVDFRQLAGSYLNAGDNNMIIGAPAYPNLPTGPTTFQLAQIVPNSDRVYGPDMSQTGTNSPTTVQSANQPLVPYTRVSATGSAGLQANQYAVNYATGQFFFAPPSTGTSNSNGEGPPVGSNVQIAFAYQNNLLDNEYTATASTVTPDTVRATYHTGKLTQVTVGIRLYNGSSHRAAFFSMSNRLQVANANR